MDMVDAEYYANGLRELADGLIQAPDKHETDFLKAAAAFIERIAEIAFRNEAIP